MLRLLLLDVLCAAWEGREGAEQYQVVSRLARSGSQAGWLWLQARWPDSVEKVTAVETGRESSM